LSLALVFLKLKYLKQIGFAKISLDLYINYTIKISFTNCLNFFNLEDLLNPKNLDHKAI